MRPIRSASIRLSAVAHETQSSTHGERTGISGEILALPPQRAQGNAPFGQLIGRSAPPRCASQRST